MTKLLILTESSPKIGLGHFTRCQSIAEAFLLHGWAANILLQTQNIKYNTEKNIIQLADWWHDLVSWQSQLEAADIVLLDSFCISEANLKTLFSIARKLVVIDDYPRREYTSGTVIDWTIGCEEYAYPHKYPNVVYLLGSQFCALRPPFWARKPRVFDSAKNIMVTFGGSDVQNLTDRVVDMMRNNFPEFYLHVVIGNKSFTRNTPHISDGRVIIYRSLDALGMKHVMDTCDIAISGGGQTLYELACCGLVPVVVELANNQHDDIVGFEKTGFAVMGGQWNDSNLFECISGKISELLNPRIREDRATRGYFAVDGQGAMRLANELITSMGYA